MKGEKLISLLFFFLLLINVFSINTNGTETNPSIGACDDWKITHWYEIYNLTDNDRIYGWTIVKIQLIEKNATDNISFEFDVPAINSSIEYYHPEKVKEAFFKNGKTQDGSYISFKANNSIFRNYINFEFAVKYKVKKEWFIKKTNEWFDSSNRYHFNTIIRIHDKFLLKNDRSDNTINIFLFLDDNINLATPNNFSFLPNDKFPIVQDVHASNRTAYEQENWSMVNEAILYLPSLEPSNENYKLISYREKTSPDYIIFEYSETNDLIVKLIFMSTIFGVIASIFTICYFFKLIYVWIRRRGDTMIFREKILEHLPSLVKFPTDPNNRCEGHTTILEQLDEGDDRIIWFQNNSMVIGMNPNDDNPNTYSGGSIELEFDVSKLPDSIINADLKISTFRTHGGIHTKPLTANSFEQNNNRKIRGLLHINGEPVDNIDLVKEMPHGKDFGFNRLESYPIIKWIKESKENDNKLKIKLETDPGVVWDIDKISIENIVNETIRIKPVVMMLIGTVIGIIGSAIGSIIINKLIK